MSEKSRSFLKNIEAKALPYTILFLFVAVSFSTIFIMLPGDDGPVHAAATTDFLHSKSITLESDQVSSDLSNFPVLINITGDTDLQADVLESGYDIAFFDSGDTQLAHEVEYFNKTDGDLVAWVNVTSLSSSVDTTIYMYYGDSDIGSSAANPSGVWDSNYLLVYHMTDSDGGLTDSTANGDDATEEGTNPVESDDYQQASFAGYSVKLDGGGNGGACETFKLPSDGTMGMANGDYEDAFTVEVWLFLVNSGYAAYYPVCLADQAQVYLGEVTGGHFAVTDDSSTGHDVTTEALARSSWSHLCGVYNGSATNEMRFIQNGVFRGEASSDTVGKPGSNNENLIGGNYNTNYWGLDGGRVDEFRLSKTVRSDDWLITTYNTCNNATDGGFFTLGEEDSAPASPGSYSINLVSDTFSFNGTAGALYWANATGTSYETMSIYTNTSGTSDNCTDIFIDFTNASSTIGYKNFSIEVRNTTDGTFDATVHQVVEAGGNVTLNATTWAAAGWCQGTNPFPIVSFNSTLEVRIKVSVPTGASAGTYTNDGNCQVVWKVLTSE